MTSSGRWSGRLTSRPLPEDDATIDALDDDARAAVVASWLGRAASERRAADVFEVVAPAARDLKMPPELVALAERAVDDELRHAELCRVVAERYAGKSLDAPPLLKLEVPRHEGASESLRRTIWVVQQCALNETTASSYLEACLEEAKGPLAHAAIRELLSDEIDHARVGWAHLAALDASARKEIAPWILRIVASNVREWRKPGPARPNESVSAHGLISPEAVERSVMEAQRDLILPGLAHVGFDLPDVRKYIEAGCPI